MCVCVCRETTDYAHQITTCPPPFLDFKTFLRPCVGVSFLYMYVCLLTTCLGYLQTFKIEKCWDSVICLIFFIIWLRCRIFYVRYFSIFLKNQSKTTEFQHFSVFFQKYLCFLLNEVLKNTQKNFGTLPWFFKKHRKSLLHRKIL